MLRRCLFRQLKSKINPYPLKQPFGQETLQAPLFPRRLRPCFVGASFEACGEGNATGSPPSSSCIPIPRDLAILYIWKMPVLILPLSIRLSCVYSISAATARSSIVRFRSLRHARIRFPTWRVSSSLESDILGNGCFLGLPVLFWLFPVSTVNWSGGFEKSEITDNQLIAQCQICHLPVFSPFSRLQLPSVGR